MLLGIILGTVIAIMCIPIIRKIFRITDSGKYDLSGVNFTPMTENHIRNIDETLWNDRYIMR